MEKFLQETFHNITDGQLSLYEVAKTIKAFLKKDPNATYSLVIGSDSTEKQDVNGKHYIQVVTAIVVHRKGFGGKYFWYKSERDIVYSLREKIYKETIQSLNLARIFVPLLQYEIENVAAKYSLEIHVDIGEFGDTRDMIHEVVGMVTGFGFVARTKPYSFAASNIADKHT